MSNYPDDIRNHDNHPSSPFYREPKCHTCQQDESDCLCGDICDNCGELRNDYFNECTCEEEF
jgi:hypothetical protein